ncbi:hypothetical protein E4U13_004937 [Claviceps humidiphila]|uniref:Uncharacterized protein n=1 Tax=Claviceps humidiphila TaxID=1294629 RepID=A0A9P7PVP2_9HYPO|nr:hypothetical protein E4U13_004937 [Claviceps humidiphila]
MSLDRYPFSLILLPTDELVQSQTRRCGPSRGNQCHVTRGQILPVPGHNAPHQTPVSEGRMLSGFQLAPNPLAQVPTTTAVRDRVPPEPAAGEYWSEVLEANLEEHKAKATKKAQEVRKKNAEATKRYREARRAEARAAAIKKEKEMKQELEQERETSRQKDERIRQAEVEKRRADAEIERLRRVDAEKDAEKRRADAEIERLRRENEELKQRK